METIAPTLFASPASLLLSLFCWQTQNSSGKSCCPTIENKVAGFCLPPERATVILLSSDRRKLHLLSDHSVSLQCNGFSLLDDVAEVTSELWNSFSWRSLEESVSSNHKAAFPISVSAVSWAICDGAVWEKTWFSGDFCLSLVNFRSLCYL